MAEGLIRRIAALAPEPGEAEPGLAAAAEMTFGDTMAVAWGGWGEPIVRMLRPVVAGDGAGLLDGTRVAGPEQAAFLHAVAGHVLDYDDVHTLSVTHPSVVIVPAILALTAARPDLAGRSARALAVGVGVNIALGAVLGFGHYDRGWHATSTIGPLAGAAALAHLLGLDATATRHAVALAATQAGGMQRNFGTMAKPVQAGNAAAAALRAALMAEAGVTASDDIFGPRGYLDLYRGEALAADPDRVEVVADLASLSRKLYPCCYITHRMIAAGIAIHGALGGEAPPPGAVIEMTVPYGTMRPLHVTDPRDGLEGKFCAAYTVAAAIAQGTVGLADFEDAAVHRAPIRRLMGQVRITEEPLSGPMPVGVNHGSIRLGLREGNRWLAEAEVRHYPGSPEDPATPAQMQAKIADCLALHARRGGDAPSPAAFAAGIRRQLALPA